MSNLNYCWGVNTHRQLGDSDISLKYDAQKFVNSIEFNQIVCGKEHTVFLDRKGQTYTCGSNTHGQLGRTNSLLFGQVDYLAEQTIVQVSCGSHHSLFLTDTGQVFSCGKNEFGQLGRGSPSADDCKSVKLVKYLSPYLVTRIACGAEHAICLTEDGRMFVWGRNDFGQLGLGHATQQNQPVEMTSLNGVSICRLACGSHHSTLLSISGAPFCFGRNTEGQLGLGDCENRLYPALCKTLRSQQVVEVVCGSQHTAALTKNGGLFTFGDGSSGQLGHNSKGNELMPKKVFELMGNTVCRVACGSESTLVLVSGGRLYGFGNGSQIALGERFYDSPVIIPLNSSTASDAKLQGIYSGFGHTFATFSSKQLAELPSAILLLDEQFVNSLCSYPAGVRPPSEVNENIEKLLTSLSCLNASFLLPDDAHRGCGKMSHGVSMDIARDCFQRLAMLPNVRIRQWIDEALSQRLLPSMQTAKFPDIEALRCLLYLPWTPAFDMLRDYSHALLSYSDIIFELNDAASNVLQSWWSLLPSDHFSRVVSCYVRVVDYVIRLPISSNDGESRSRGKALHLFLELLNKLYKVNDTTGHNGIISYEAFYISGIHEVIDIRNDYIGWLKHNHSNTPQQTSFASFCTYPFIFDGSTKTLLLQIDAEIQMQIAVDQAQQRNFVGLMTGQFRSLQNPFLVLRVNRNNIVNDTLQQLTNHNSMDFKKPLKVEFLGEEAMDAGGVRKEFFMILLREILDPKYGMFRYMEESRMLWFSGVSFEEDLMFGLIGMLFGLAIYNNTIIDINFPLALYKRLLKKDVTLEDLFELKPQVAKSLSALLDYEEDDFEDVFGLNFEINTEMYGEVQYIELRPGGKRECVTLANKNDYVKLYIEHIFYKGVRQQFESFDLGFQRVAGGKVMDLFQAQELRAMVVGNENYDWVELQRTCTYKSGYHEHDDTIKYFWQAFHDMTQKQKKKFLLFLTGSDRIPIHGMKALRMCIQPLNGSLQHWPVAHTCFNLLDLPRYNSLALTKEKLLCVIEHTQGFGLI